MNKKYKYKIINYLENKCNNSKIRNITILNILRALHFTIPIFILIISFFVSKKILIIIFFISLIKFILFMYFNCCILSLLELKLSKNDNYTIVDIYLELLDIEINNKNRKKFTCLGSTLNIIIILLIYIYRFLL